MVYCFKRTKYHSSGGIGCGIWKDRIIRRSLLFGGTEMGDAYLRVLNKETFPSVLNPDGDSPTWFQQDGTPVHYSLCAREWPHR
jgi:hypothetical protein